MFLSLSFLSVLFFFIDHSSLPCSSLYFHSSLLFSSTSPLTLTIEANAGVVHISDPLPAFTKLLQFLYGMTISFPDDDFESILELVSLANFYGITELRSSLFKLLPFDDMDAWQIFGIPSLPSLLSLLSLPSPLSPLSPLSLPSPLTPSLNFSINIFINLL